MKIIDFIIAEDVRNEIGNKYSLMGIFSEKVFLPKPPPNITGPIAFRLGLFIRIDKENSPILPDSIKVEILHDGNLILPIVGPVGHKSESPFVVIVATASAIPLPGPGTLSFNLELLANAKIIFSAQNPFPINVCFQDP